MTEIIRIHKRKLMAGLIIALLIIALLFVGFKWSQQAPQTVEEEKESEEVVQQIVERKASTVAFGDWSPSEFRTVLGQVSSDSDVSVKAELSGTIARVNVKVGDKVVAGQALASYKTSGDPTAINYQSALSSLQTTKLSGQNSVRSAELTVENAQKLLQQTMAQQDQSYDQAYENLRVETLNSDSLIGVSLDKLDQMVQFTNKHTFNQSFAYSQIGNNDTILQQVTKNQGRELGVVYVKMTGVAEGSSENTIVQQANVRRKILEDLQAAYGNLGLLLRRGTVTNTIISNAELNGFIAEADAITDALNIKVATLQTKIDSAKGSRESSRLATLNAKNALESAQASLELTKSQIEANVIGAQNQVNLAGASTADLTVRAPISGTITAKSVNVGSLVSPGNELFTIVNQEQNKKVVAYLNQDEWRQVQITEKVEIEIDGEVVESSDIFLSPQLNVQTQKVLAEFTIPAGVTLVGNLATVRIPIGSSNAEGSNLLPFSAVSFEPDGPEVLVVNQSGVAERKKVIVDRVVVSNIEIVSGLEAGEMVVEFYKRVFPGEQVMNDEIKAQMEAAAQTEKAKNITSADVVDEAANLELNLNTDE